MFKHPSYYKKLRSSQVKKSDQAISFESGTPPNERALDPGLKLGEMDIASSKQQASSTKLLEERATSIKRQA